MQVRLRTIGWSIAGLAVLAAVGSAVFVWSGIYDVAASTEHMPATYKLLHFTMRRSVAMHADGIRPPKLDDAARVRDGVIHYQKYCIQCHGAPGIAPDPVAIGMMPPPANLASAGRDWQPAELYWVVRHGVKMTAMPAWEYKMSEEELWNVVALLKRLPQLSPQEYQGLARNMTREVANVQRTASAAAPLRPGNPQAGRRAVTQYLCATCHRMRGVAGADNDVGPPLAGIASRAFIGGVLKNTQENMVRWLLDPQAVDPKSAMPNLGLSEQDARDIAAFLYTAEATKE